MTRFSYENQRQERLKRRKHKKVLRRRQNIILGVLASVVLFLALRFVSSKLASNSRAEGSRFLGPEFAVEDSVSTEVASTETEEPAISYVTEQKASEEELVLKTEKEQAGAFQDTLDCFLVTTEDTILYSRNSVKSNEIAVIPKGTYIETYGTENNWTKVVSVGRMGYIRNRDLEVVSDPNQFKVVSGHLIVNSKYSLPESYETVFNDEVEVAMRVMLEAMERDGLHVEIATTYRSAEDEAKELVLRGTPEGAPTAGHAVFQTGNAVQFYVKGTDPRLDNEFEKTEQFKWLKEHAHEYGFVLRYPEGSEPITGYRADSTIFYYVGIQDASLIAGEDITMETFYGVHH